MTAPAKKAMAFAIPGPCNTKNRTKPTTKAGKKDILDKCKGPHDCSRKEGRDQGCNRRCDGNA
eukprot:6966484-Lingulodinium_polyedra.AAC.1